jgi:arylsulfatase A-like enzyme
MIATGRAARSSASTRAAAVPEVRRTLLAGAAAALVGACSREPQPESAAARAAPQESAPFAGSSLLVVTLDTTRRDALGFAQRAPGFAARTPVLDALAARSLEFTDAWTAAPVTLPAHASLFTGLWPASHGARDNLGSRLPATAETLAERLAERGFATAAVVAAPVVGPASGLDQGFGRFLAPDPASGVLEKPARVVTDEALAELSRFAAAPAPFFLWVHYFDAHAPHVTAAVPALPGELLTGSDPRADLPAYRAEVERIDRNVARLLEGARAAAGRRPLAIVVAADHGEALGDHGEATHGHRLHGATLRVPLLVSHPRVPPGRCGQLASLVDLLPTLLEGFGLDGAEQLQGRSLLPWLTGERRRDDLAPRTVVFESRMPWHEFGWPWLDGACDGRFLWADRPRPVLFDLAADPDELHDLTAAEPARAAALAEACARAAALGAPIDAADASRGGALVSLGYVAARREPPADKSSLPEPEDRFALVELRDRGLELLSRGDFGRARDAFEELRRRNVDPAPATLLLAVAGSRQAESLPDGEERRLALSKAASAWRTALQSCPGDALRHFNLAMTLLDLGAREEAVAELVRARQLAPDDPSIERQLAAARRGE